MFNELNQKQKQANNALINESERNDTITSTIPNYSTFDKSFQQATTFDSGKAIPILCQEVYPGDIYEIDIENLIKLSAMVSTPFMNINYDINFFFVPYTQLDKEFKNVMGENNDYGYNDSNIQFPLLEIDSDFEYNENDLANYFNIPINKNFNGETLNLYPFLAYGKIWNEWYRDQNLQSSIDISSCFNNDRKLKTSTKSNDTSFYTNIIYGKKLAPTSKLPNYFTTNLPYQQKGEPIRIPTNLSNLIISNGDSKNKFNPTWYDNSGNVIRQQSLLSIANNGATITTNQDSGSYVKNANISLKASGEDIFPTINDLRYSIVAQHLLENFALCGSRYVEQLKSIWGISIDPKEIGRSELIGGYNDSLVFSNVAQTSQTSGTNNLGKLSSNLYNSINLPKVSYASSQHGLIIGILTCRTQINNGGQGLPKMFSYNDYLDLFNPIFNGIGEQPTLNKELYFNDSNKSKNNNTFGFNEPFLNTKYNIDNANGYMSLNSNVSLFSYFLYGEKYEDTPTLNEEWITFDPNIIGNTLYNVSNETKEFYHQFISIFTFYIKYTTKQPLFNSPRVYGI